MAQSRRRAKPQNKCCRNTKNQKSGLSLIIGPGRIAPLRLTCQGATSKRRYPTSFQSRDGSTAPAEKFGSCPAVLPIALRKHVRLLDLKHSDRVAIVGSDPSAVRAVIENRRFGGHRDRHGRPGVSIKVDHLPTVSIISPVEKLTRAVSEPEPRSSSWAAPFQHRNGTCL